MIINEGWQVWRGGVVVGAVILDLEGNMKQHLNGVRI